MSITYILIIVIIIGIMIQTFIRFFRAIKQNFRFFFKRWICMLVRMVKPALSSICIADILRSGLKYKYKIVSKTDTFLSIL